MKFSSSTTKAPVAELGGTRDEGLESPTPQKEQENMNSLSAAIPTRLDLDGLTVDVQPVDDHIEVTVIAAGRATHGLALDPSEARKLASVLLDASAPAFGHTDAAEIEEHVAVARKLGQPHESLTPAQYCKRQRDQQQDHLDVQIAIEGSTVTDLWHEAERLGVSPSDVLRKLEEARA